MPVNSMTITDRKITEFVANSNSGNLDISGKYKVKLKNEGVLPVLRLSYNIEELIPKSSSKNLVSSQSKDINRLSPDSEKTLSISFDVTVNQDELMTLAQTGCSGSEVSADVKESIQARLLQVPFDETQKLPVSAGSCSLNGQDAGRDEVEQAPEVPDRPEASPVQRVTMRIDGPEEVPVDRIRDWRVLGENVSEVDTIRVDLGDGNTTTATRQLTAEPQPQLRNSRQGFGVSAMQTNPSDGDSSNVPRTFGHTYQSTGQYTIVAEAVNSNGQTVGSARYSVTVNETDSEDDVETTPAEPARFDIAVDGNNAPVNPGQQMLIDYTVRNTGESTGTGNITMDVDGSRADSSRRTVQAGSSSSGTLTGTAPEINSGSVNFRPRITAQNVDSNTVTPTFQVTRDDNGDNGQSQPEPGDIDVSITGTSVNNNNTVDIRFRLSNVGGRPKEVRTFPEVNRSSIGNTDVYTVEPGQTMNKSYNVDVSGYSGDITVGIGTTADARDRVDVNLNQNQDQSGPANLSVNITNTNAPVDAGTDVRVSYIVTNAGEQSADVLTLMERNGNGIGTPNDIVVPAGETTINTHSWSTAGPPNQDNNPPNPVTLTVRTTGGFNASDSVDVNVNRQQQDQPDPANMRVNITGTNAPVGITEDLTVRYRVENTGGQRATATVEGDVLATTSAPTTNRHTLDAGRATRDELVLQSTQYGSSGQKTVRLSTDDTTDESTFVVEDQQQNNQQNEFDSTSEITNNLDGINAAREIIGLHGDTLREYDTDSNGELGIDENGQAGQDFASGQLSQDEFDAVAYFVENNQNFPQTVEAEQRYLNNAEVIHEYDADGNGEIDINELGAAGTAFGRGEITNEQNQTIGYMFDNGVRFPAQPDGNGNQVATSKNSYLPPLMSEINKSRSY